MEADEFEVGCKLGAEVLECKGPVDTTVLNSAKTSSIRKIWDFYFHISK